MCISDLGSFGCRYRKSDCYDCAIEPWSALSYEMKKLFITVACIFSSLLLTSCEPSMGDRTVLQSEIVGDWTYVELFNATYQSGTLSIKEDGSFIKTPQATYNPDPELNISYPGVMTITNGRAKIEYASFYNDYEGKITQSKIYDQIWYVDHKLAFGKNCRVIHYPLNGNEWK